MDLSNVQNINELQRLLTPKMTKYVPYEPTPKQTAFLLMNQHREILYGGAAGGGKSVAQLMAALQFVDVPGYSAILFRATLADLELPGALMDMAKQWLAPFVNSKEVKWSEKRKRFTFPSGATLIFGYLEAEGDCNRYQGAEFQYIGMDECTHISPSNYTYLHSRLRNKKEIGVPLRFRATANPGGKFGDYYYERFFEEGPEKGRIFIGAGLDDNPHLDAEEYRKSLDELSPIERERLLNGNWQIKAAGDIFNKDWFSIVPPTNVVASAQRCRFWDMASTDPNKRKKAKGRDKRQPDWTVGLKMAHHQGIYWIEDIVRVQKTPFELEKILKDTAEHDGFRCKIRMEKEPGSSGDIVADHYARNVLNGYDFKAISSTGSKVERAGPVSSASEQGRVHIVNTCRNKQALLDEVEVFPFGLKDDTVDALSGAFNELRTKVVVRAPSGVKKAGGSYWKRAYREYI